MSQFFYVLEWIKCFHGVILLIFKNGVNNQELCLQEWEISSINYVIGGKPLDHMSFTYGQYGWVVILGLKDLVITMG